MLSMAYKLAFGCALYMAIKSVWMLYIYNVSGRYLITIRLAMPKFVSYVS